MRTCTWTMEFNSYPDSVRDIVFLPLLTWISKNPWQKEAQLLSRMFSKNIAFSGITLLKMEGEDPEYDMTGFLELVTYLDNKFPVTGTVKFQYFRGWHNGSVPVPGPTTPAAPCECDINQIFRGDGHDLTCPER